MWSVVALRLVGCGSSDPDSWEKCDELPCNTGASSRWDVYADGGDVDERDWDFLGPPDPYICLSVGGRTECSSSVSDSSRPRWSDLLFSEISASQLVGTSLGVRYVDKDTDSWLDDNDAICSGSLRITPADLAEGGVRFDCERGSATFTFHFVR